MIIRLHPVRGNDLVVKKSRLHTFETSTVYNAEITAGSLLLRESRVIVRLLRQGVDSTEWKRAIVVENVLQKTSPASAIRMARLLKNRLAPMHFEFWEMIAEGTTEVSIQSLMAAAIKHSRLLGDFMLQVLRRHYLEFNKRLLSREWDAFLVDCEHVDPAVKNWSVSTRNKAGQVVLRILAEAGYLENTQSLVLQTVSIAPEVSKFLHSRNEDYVLRCMEVANG